MLDDVLDHLDAAADLIVLYRPRRAAAEMSPQVDVPAAAPRLTAEAMPRLRTPKDLEDYWIEVNRLENEADQLYRRLLATLFSGGTTPMTALKLKDVVDGSRRPPTRSSTCADTVETIAAKES